MTNRLKNQVEQDDAEELNLGDNTDKDYPDNFLTLLFTKGILNADSATRALPFIFFMAFLGMVYIANRHLAEKNIRDIDKISKEVKELSFDYKTTKAELAYKSTLGEIAKRVDTLGIKVPVQPPQKITQEVQDEH